ncbi:unnamed protein product, partial [Didymodactylos carnosus]
VSNAIIISSTQIAQDLQDFKVLFSTFISLFPPLFLKSAQMGCALASECCPQLKTSIFDLRTNKQAIRECINPRFTWNCQAFKQYINYFANQSTNDTNQLQSFASELELIFDDNQMQKSYQDSITITKQYCGEHFDYCVALSDNKYRTDCEIKTLTGLSQQENVYREYVQKEKQMINGLITKIKNII